MNDHYAAQIATHLQQIAHTLAQILNALNVIATQRK